MKKSEFKINLNTKESTTNVQIKPKEDVNL